MKLIAYNSFFCAAYGAEEFEAELCSTRKISKEGDPVLTIFLPDGSNRQLNRLDLEVADLRVKSATSEEREKLRDIGVHLSESRVGN